MKLSRLVGSGLAICLVTCAACSFNKGGVTADAGPDVASECFRRSDCDDGNPCTDDVCEDGVCIHTTLQDGEPCDDGKVCTWGDTCASGQCVGEAVDCSSTGDFCNTG